MSKTLGPKEVSLILADVREYVEDDKAGTIYEVSPKMVLDFVVSRFAKNLELPEGESQEFRDMVYFG